MDKILDQLPDSQKWTLYFLIASGISLLGNIIGINIIGIIFGIVLLVFLFMYRNHCKKAYEDQSYESLEDACRWQKNILIVQGIQAALLLLFLILAVIGVGYAVYVAATTPTPIDLP